MNKDRRQAPFVNVGSSLLLVIFLLLCLITFATLSFSSAQSDESFSQRIAQRKTDYYEACNQAERLLPGPDQRQTGVGSCPGTGWGRILSDRKMADHHDPAMGER